MKIKFPQFTTAMLTGISFSTEREKNSTLKKNINWTQIIWNTSSLSCVHDKNIKMKTNTIFT